MLELYNSCLNLMAIPSSVEWQSFISEKIKSWEENLAG